MDRPVWRPFKKWLKDMNVFFEKLQIGNTNVKWQLEIQMKSKETKRIKWEINENNFGVKKIKW